MWGVSVPLLFLVSSTRQFDLVVQFDGSLRSPHDPGFASAPGQWASCAACIFNGNHQLVRMGGKRLEAGLSTSSGEIEYEGLILGLSEFQRYLAQINSVSCNGTRRVLVMGDCRTAIEQMQGRSRPRKLSNYYEQASEIATALNIDCEFRHCPRSKNELCDRLALSIIKMQEDVYKKQLREALESLIVSPTKSNFALKNIVDEWFNVCSSKVPFSIRPEVYRYLAAISAATFDFSIQLHIGTQWQREVETVWKVADPERVRAALGCMHEHDCTRESINALVAESLAYKLLALEQLGRYKEATVQRRKKRYLLENYADTFSQVHDRLSRANRLNHLKPPCLSNWSAVSCTEQDFPPTVVQWQQEAVESNGWIENGVFWKHFEAA